MAYGDDIPVEKSNIASRIAENDSFSFNRPTRTKLKRQSISEQLFKQLHHHEKTSSSLQNLKQDVTKEAVVIDLPSIETDSQEGSDNEDGSKHFSRWGPTRGSNSYSNCPSIPVSQLSTLNLRQAKKNGPDDSAV